MSLDKSASVESDTRNIEESEDLSGKDKELLLDFKRDLKLDGASDAHVHKLLCQLRIMGERLEAQFEDATTDELKGLVEWVHGRDLSGSTKQNYRKSLKRFYRWLNGGEFPEKVKWINTTGKRKNRKLPQNLLTESDIEDLIDATENSRDPALIGLLWETGARIGELLYLKVGCLEERKRGKKIVIRGKTGPRRLPLISSLPRINNWLANHPEKGDPEAPLWCKIHGANAGEHECQLVEPPQIYDAGTPNIPGKIGLGRAAEYVMDIGLEEIERRERELIRKMSEIRDIGGVEVYGPKPPEKIAGVLSFNLNGMDSHEVSSILDEVADIATRSGHHCADPAMGHFDLDSTARASVHYYNTEEEIEEFIKTLTDIAEELV